MNFCYYSSCWGICQQNPQFRLLQPHWQSLVSWQPLSTTVAVTTVTPEITNTSNIKISCQPQQVPLQLSKITSIGIGHASTAVMNISQAIPHISQAIPRIRQAIPHICQAIPHICTAIPHICQAIPHICLATSHICQAIPHICQAIPHICQAIPHICQAIPHIRHAISNICKPFHTSPKLFHASHDLLHTWLPSYSTYLPHCDVSPLDESLDHRSVCRVEIMHLDNTVAVEMFLQIPGCYKALPAVLALVLGLE